MTIQFSTTLRNARIAAIETGMGTAIVVKIFSGAQPANCAAANSGTELVSYTLASDWATNSGATLTFSSTPISGTAIAGAPTNAGHYRAYASDGTTCHMQGTVTATGGGGDMTLDNISIASGQSVQITGWTITDGNA
jgi:hypothetical protein